MNNRKSLTTTNPWQVERDRLKAGLSPRAERLLDVLKTFVWNPKLQEAKVGIRRLAKEMGTGVNQVQADLDELEAAGRILKLDMEDRTTGLYRILKPLGSPCRLTWDDYPQVGQERWVWNMDEASPEEILRREVLSAMCAVIRPLDLQTPGRLPPARVVKGTTWDDVRQDDIVDFPAAAHLKAA